MKNFSILFIFLFIFGFLNFGLIQKENQRTAQAEIQQKESAKEEKEKFDLLPLFQLNECIEEFTFIEKENALSSYYSDISKTEIKIKYTILEIQKLLVTQAKLQLLNLRIENSSGWINNRYQTFNNEWIIADIDKSWKIKSNNYSPRVQEMLKLNLSEASQLISFINKMVFLPSFYPKSLVAEGDEWEQQLGSFFGSSFYTIDNISTVKMRFDKIETSDNSKVAHISYSASAKSSSTRGSSNTQNSRINGKLLFDLIKRKLLAHTFLHIVEHEEDWGHYYNAWETSQQVTTTYSFTSSSKNQKSDLPNEPKTEE